MASLIPPGKVQFLDSDGKPLSGGSVAFYTPGTSDLKPTYQDAAETTLNTNPVILDAAGEAVIYGTGAYRQVVTDAAGNLIWDQETSEPGSQVESVNVSGAISAGSISISGDAGVSGNGSFGSLSSDFIDATNGTVQAGFLTSTTVQAGTLGASGNTGLSGDLAVGGNTGLAGSLTVTGVLAGAATGWQMNPSGTGAFAAPYSVNIAATSGGVVASAFIAASDARVKINVEDVPFLDAYRFVREMRAKVFMKDGAPDAGFIAQDAITNGFQRMVVITNTDDPRMLHGDDVSPVGKRLNLNYNHATAYHHRMIDYLIDRVDELQKQIDLLKN